MRPISVAPKGLQGATAHLHVAATARNTGRTPCVTQHIGPTTIGPFRDKTLNTLLIHPWVEEQLGWARRGFEGSGCMRRWERGRKR